MLITIGIDIGTTTITALALDAATGKVAASATVRNDAETTTTADKARGRSEWDAARMAERTCELLRGIVVEIGPHKGAVAGIGMTGQQHGVVLVDEQGRPITPFINWQDRRGEDRIAGGSVVEHTVRAAGPEAAVRAGCTLSAGFMGTTLYWMNATGALPRRGTACFITDYLGARLTGARPVTDPTMGASSGLFHLQERRWDQETLRALGLPSEIFPEVRESGDRFGGLCSEAARAAGLPEGLPVFVGMGDNQASFLGSVAYRNDTALVNVGTGAQVARYVERAYHAPPLETRPFPRGGYLLVFAGLCGGRSYAILERFFRQVGAEVLGVERQDKVYAVMNALAEKAPKGADGLRCDPYFAGSRPDPTRRATWTGVSEKNFTPAHAVRALLEGMARSFREGYDLIRATAGGDCARLVGAGNGLRENAVLAGIVSEEFGMPLSVPAHREEAAYGAALAAGVGAGVWPDLAAAGKIIRFQ